MKYDDGDKKRIKDQDVRDYVPNLKGRGTKVYAKCPKCGNEKGLVYDKVHNGMHCFHCDYHMSGAIGAIMEYQNVGVGEAMDVIARDLGIMSQSEKRAANIAHQKRVTKKSFCEKQLDASGLSVDDVMARVNHDGMQVDVPTFRKGGKNRLTGEINENDDEMLIYYYDLYGNLMTYTKKGSSKPRSYVRVRWSNPSAHIDTDGKETKYGQPAGAPTRIYIPQRIRTAFLDEEKIETLVIQEGEKKAEKACKHGILSVGIQGIYNIGNEETGLIQDLQYLVQRCSIKNIILLFDSDWDKLGSTLEPGTRVDSRPNSFFGAARKFKTYVQTLHGAGVSVDIYIGHINDNERDDKGIDDLLVGTLKGEEPKLLADLQSAMVTHDGKGTYLTVTKVTTKSDNQIKDLWSLNDPQAFFEKYRDKLKDLPTFKIGSFTYRIEDDKLIRANKFSDKEFWQVVQGEKKRIIEFDPIEALEFITSNGFYRIHTADLEVDQYKFVRIEDGIVSLSGPTEIRDLIYEYVLTATHAKDVRNFFASRLGSLLGPDKLERVAKIEDAFDWFYPNLQKYYFANGQIEITATDIKHSERIVGNVWKERILPRKFKRVPIIESIVKNEDGTFTISDTEDGRACEFWSFIQNTSNFWERAGYTPTADDEALFMHHLVNKITTIGFLLVDYKHKSEQKAVVAMDGQLGDVGQSNGRTGKSLIGVALSQMLKQTYIDGRNTSNDDNFVYSMVNLRTRNIFLDDVRVNFDFERFFGALTGDMVINPKMGARFTISQDRSPKFYITTNHAVNVVSRSAKDRISYMAFSDWYNDNHSPIDDFKHTFFDDWEDDQWNMFYNFMAECVMYYFKSMEEGWYRPGRGAVPPPMAMINQRTLKQQMGEAFFQWAEPYFDESAGHLNEKIERKAMFDDYRAAFPDAKFVTASNFKEKLKFYCQFKGYHLNINMPDKSGMNYKEFIAANPDESFIGEAYKSGGKEYFSVFSAEAADKQPF